MEFAKKLQKLTQENAKQEDSLATYTRLVQKTTQEIFAFVQKVCVEHAKQGEKKAKMGYHSDIFDIYYKSGVDDESWPKDTFCEDVVFSLKQKMRQEGLTTITKSSHGRGTDGYYFNLDLEIWW